MDLHRSLEWTRTFLTWPTKLVKLFFYCKMKVTGAYVCSVFLLCTKSFSLERAHDTRLGSLLFGDYYIVLQNCDIKTVKVPVIEKARKIDNGKWIIISASPNFDMYVNTMRINGPLTRTKLA